MKNRRDGVSNVKNQAMEFRIDLEVKQEIQRDGKKTTLKRASEWNEKPGERLSNVRERTSANERV